MQSDAGLEALRINEDRTVELTRIAKESEELKSFIRWIDEFDRPNADLGTYVFVAPEI